MRARSKIFRTINGDAFRQTFCAASAYVESDISLTWRDQHPELRLSPVLSHIHISGSRELKQISVPFVDGRSQR